MDKTGTITVGEPKIVETHTAEGVCEKEMILLAASAEIHSVHPLAVAIQKLCRGTRLESTRPHRFRYSSCSWYGSKCG